MDAERAMQFLMKQQQHQEGCEKGAAAAASRIATHPLYTPIMMCIEGGVIVTIESQTHHTRDIFCGLSVGLCLISLQ